MPTPTLRNAFLAMFCTATLFFSAPALARDANDRFAIDGAGRSACQDFAKAQLGKSEQLRVYAGWIDGYISALNRQLPETYDITPWQSVELLVAKLALYCNKFPDQPLIEAVNELVRVLYPARLQTASKVTRVEVGPSAVFLYDAMVPRLHAALAAQGQDAGADTTTYSAEMAAAVRRFQTAKGLPLTGLPDQITLNALFP